VKQKLHYNTVTPFLKECLIQLSNEKLFNPFRLVGGTALSLQIGHRMSIDIDFFTDHEYDSIDFTEIEKYLATNFPYFEKSSFGLIGFGTSYFIGENAENAIKLDLYYTDSFVFDPIVTKENIRLASIDEIIAMKLDVVLIGGRKKDFWDLHEFIGKKSLHEFLDLHKLRYPYTQNESELTPQLINFDKAEDDFDPICLKNKAWDIVKLDFMRFVD
jgi:hypothetical protein